MLEIPTITHLIFIIATVITATFVIAAIMKNDTTKAKRRTNLIAMLLLCWLIFQSTLALNKYFLDTKSMPPKMFFPVITSAVIMLLLFVLPRGRKFLDSLSIKTLTWIHVVRIPVEIVLYQLASEKQIPWSMTFDGRNFDILSGISAPIVAWLYFRKKTQVNWWFAAWNMVALILVLNVVIDGILSVPSPLQSRNFDQPNLAVTHFPFVWLPGFIVPVVVFSHLVVLRHLFLKKTRRKHAEN